MSITLGLPLRDFFAFVLGRSDLKSMFCLIVFSIVVSILAYLTNPTENSFRAYLTEQSFRHHLSKLDDNGDDNSLRVDCASPLVIPKASISSSVFASDNSFPFANRASISLRTPKHVFHSFGIFTIAAMVPTTKGSEKDSGMISDSWYIGAFGRWWRGGVFEEWYRDVIIGLKDEESRASGILNVKRLDILQDYKVPTFSANNRPDQYAPGSPPRLRNPEKSTQSNSSVARSVTPPPLPKTASLPMHTVRSGNRMYESTRLRQQQSLVNPENTNTTRITAPPSRSTSISFEQSPAIAEVLRQIGSAKTSVADLHGQLMECQTNATQSRSVLQQEVDSQRERKRHEDRTRSELKIRTKNFEDTKRHAEALKKEADKKLKVAQVTRDDTVQHMEFLDSGIRQLQDQLSQDVDFISSRKVQIVEDQRSLPNSIEQKRQEIKVTEDQIQALNQRSRQLEEHLSSRKERLRILREKIERIHERRPAANFDPQQQICRSQDPWQIGWDDSGHSLRSLVPVHSIERVWNRQSDPAMVQQPSTSITSSGTLDEFSPFCDPPLFIARGNDQLQSVRGSVAPEFYQIGLDAAMDEDSNIFKPDTGLYGNGNGWLAYPSGNLDAATTISSSASSDDAHFSPFSRPGHHYPSVSLGSLTSKSRIGSSTLSSKGLNPGAKEFNFVPSSNVVHSRSSAPKLVTNDVLNPSGFPSPTTSTPQSLLRAFALSPAEREALQRMGNRSLERLPSLSDVGSIPPSPSSNGHNHPSLNSDFGGRLPTWLQSLPRNRKVNFSPWDDEEKL